MNSTFSLLLVDDDSLIADSLRIVLPKTWQLHIVTRESDLPQEGSFHAAFVDMHLTQDLSRAEGPSIIGRLKELFPRAEVVAISGDLSLKLMEACLEKGATKFLAKPLMVDEVKADLEKIEALWRLREIEHRPQGDQAQWVGRSKVSETLKMKLAQLRGEKGPILIEGETGTGKEVVARLLHQQDPARPFVPVNISAIPEHLFESELFGHVKGAFTGADQMKIGLCDAASGGDLFLDEIEALPLTQQVKLLRFLESGEVRKVGAKEAHRVQVRVIAASNQNLEALVKEGKFREDLLFRLKAKKILLPPLRDRLEDVEDLAKFFLSQERPRSNKIFTPEAFETLKKYRWPGNVRELRRVCEQLSLASPLPMIRPLDVSKILTLDTPVPATDVPTDGLGLQEMIERFEASVIQRTLTDTRDIEASARQLKISRSSLYKKIKDYGLEVFS